MNSVAPLRVCLVGLLAAGHSGIPRYTVRLSQALDEISGEFPQLELSLLTTPTGAAAVNPHHLRVRVTTEFQTAIASGAGRVLAEQLAARATTDDLLHFFDLSGPLFAPSRPFVTTVHDASIVHGFRRYRYAYKRPLFPWALKRARACVAISEFARDEAVTHFAANPKKIHVVRSGPGLTPLAATAPPETDGPRYILFVGNLSASKNVPFLIRAFERVDGPTRLVLAGNRGDRFGDVERALSSSAARDRIDVLHGRTDEEVDALYRKAAALALPSRYEGFGFTPLEAMARGCPVLASDIPGIREISGDGAMLLPLDDEDGWAAAMRAVMAEEQLADTLRKKGASVVARYSWNDTARLLCELLLATGAVLPKDSRRR